MSERDELEKRIQSEGIDPEEKCELFDMAEYGNVFATLWRQPTSAGEATCFVVKLEHAGDSSPDGLPFDLLDSCDIEEVLLWMRDHVEALFFL